MYIYRREMKAILRRMVHVSFRAGAGLLAFRELEQHVMSDPARIGS